MQCYTQHSLLMKHVYGIWKDQYQRSRILRMEETLKDAHINTESMGAKYYFIFTHSLLALLGGAEADSF